MNLKKKVAALCLAACMVFQINIPANVVHAAEQTVVTPTGDDELIIPDKYNTGCKGELTDFYSLSFEEQTAALDGISPKVSDSTIINLTNQPTQSGTYTIENIDFSKGKFSYNHSTDLDVTFVFNNCKFGTVFTGGNAKTVFNHCSMAVINSRDAELNYCQLGHTYSDPIRPFNNSYFNNCFIADIQHYFAGEQHMDGTQIFGNQAAVKPRENQGPDAFNIHFKNCRFELPTYYTGEGNIAHMNDCIFVQNEYSVVYDVTFEDIITNGAGYQFSAHRYTRKNETTPLYDLYNVSLNRCRMGEGSILGLMTANEPFVEITDTDFNPNLYVASSWKDDAGTHFSVTNDTLRDRTLTIVTDKGVYSQTIPAFFDPDVTNQPGSTVVYDDYPIDLDICVPADKYAVCYDTTFQPVQVRFVNYTEQPVYVDQSVLNQYTTESKVISEGTCGTALTYTLTNDGTLTISGTGAMTNFHSALLPPWNDLYVRKVIVEDGVTTIGNQAFNGKELINEVLLPASLVSIGGSSFGCCYSLTDITIPSNIQVISPKAFDSCFMAKLHYYGDNWSAIEGREIYFNHGDYYAWHWNETPDIKDINTVTITPASCEYTGKNQTVKLTLTNDSGKELVENVDYTITGNTVKEIGTYTFTITGINDYKGSREYTFKVTAASLGDVTLSQTKFTYNGAVQKPTVVVKNKSGKVLTEDKDYTVTYPSGMKTPGKYTITIKGIKLYKGSVKKSFTIIPKTTTPTLADAGKGSLKITWKKQSAITGYQIQYSTNDKFESGYKSVRVTDAATLTKTITGLSTGKKYYVRMRTYKTVDDKDYFSAWSDIKSITLKAPQTPEKPQQLSCDVLYQTHVQTYSWQDWKKNGESSGTEGEAKRLEAIKIKLENAPYKGGIYYTTHVQTYGWQGNESDPTTWKKDGALSGTEGESKRLEAIRIKLYGNMEKYFDVYYRVHAQSYGWLDWAKNGEPAGTAGLAKRLEAIQIQIVPKGGKAPGATTRPYVTN